jgi:cation diffusion facilitator family transporter
MRLLKELKGTVTRSHSHEHRDDSHDHRHGRIDSQIITTERGIKAVKMSFIFLMITAALQAFVVALSGSVALLADTVHNFGDAFTAIPLWIAFKLAKRRPSDRFPYGYGRVEDLAGVFIVLVILTSAVLAGYESVMRFFHPTGIRHLWMVVAAGLIGFVGNELVAQYRIRIGKEIKSTALVADGHHARVDGLTSLGVLLSALGLRMGWSLADPIIGCLISLAILRISWGAGKDVFLRLLDGVDPEIVAEIREAVHGQKGVVEITDVRVRWLGHRLQAELNLTVPSDLSVTKGHDIAVEAKERILHTAPYLWNANIHIDPQTASGEDHH